MKSTSEGRRRKVRLVASPCASTEVKIADIIIGPRHRKDHGDLAALAASIQEIGMLHPIGVTSGRVLVFGERRLRACRDVLGWDRIPARVVNLPSILAGEFAENGLRKDWTPSERVAIVDSLHSFRHGGDRRSDQARTRDDEMLTIDQAAKLVGFGGKDGFFRASKFIERGVPELVEAVDRGEVTISVAAEIADLGAEMQRSLLKEKRSWTIKEVVGHKKRIDLESRQIHQRLPVLSPVASDWTLTGEDDAIACALLLVALAFGFPDQPCAVDGLEAFNRAWAAKWSACGADFVAVIISQSQIWEGKNWFDETLKGYVFHQMLVWHAPNSRARASHSQFGQTWEPILLYRRAASARQIHPQGTVWTGELHDLDCHIAPVPRASDAGPRRCQWPVSVMKWLINALTLPGERVASLFCGAAPCGVASLQLKRQYHGVEADERLRAGAAERLRAFGHPDPPRAAPAVPLVMNSVYEGDCLDLIPALSRGSINLVVTSPPYSDQRKGLYRGVPDRLYPKFTVRWMSALWDKLTPDGSVLIVIRPNLKNGVLNDYVLRTRLDLREAGWKECETLIWHKPDGGGCMGSTSRPRRTYEEILWFSKSGAPFVAPKACGRLATKVSRAGPHRYADGRWALPKDRPSRTNQPGRTRLADVIRVAVRRITQGIDHPAIFPVELAEILIQTFSPKTATVLDCFCGSGSALLAARHKGRNFYGFDVVPDYCDIARRRLAEATEADLGQATAKSSPRIEPTSSSGSAGDG